MQFDIITIFPEIFNSYLSQSLISRAIKKKLIKINIHNLRNWTQDKHKTVDDRPFGGGFGMVMKVEPIYKAVSEIKKKYRKPARNATSAQQPDNSHGGGHSVAGGTKIILFTPRGKKFNQKIAYQFSKLNQTDFYLREIRRD